MENCALPGGGAGAHAGNRCQDAHVGAIRLILGKRRDRPVRVDPVPSNRAPSTSRVWAMSNPNSNWCAPGSTKGFQRTGTGPRSAARAQGNRHAEIGLRGNGKRGTQSISRGQSVVNVIRRTVLKPPKAEFVNQGPHGRRRVPLPIPGRRCAAAGGPHPASTPCAPCWWQGNQASGRASHAAIDQ